MYVETSFKRSQVISALWGFRHPYQFYGLYEYVVSLPKQSLKDYETLLLYLRIRTSLRTFRSFLALADKFYITGHILDCLKSAFITKLKEWGQPRPRFCPWY